MKIKLKWAGVYYGKKLFGKVKKLLLSNFPNPKVFLKSKDEYNNNNNPKVFLKSKDECFFIARILPTIQGFSKKGSIITS